MKKLLPIMFLLTGFLFAAESDTLPPFMDNFAHSAPAASAPTYFQADIHDEVPGVTLTDSYLKYSTNGWTTMSEVPASDMGLTGTQSYQATVNNPSSGTVEYYFHFESEDKWAGQCPLYDGTATPSIPENFLLYCGFDGAGTDSTLPDHSDAEDLDLLEYWFGMSDDRFYGKMRNATGTWHLENGNLFSGKDLFGYGISINNPDRPDEDYMYLMAQCGNLTISGIVDISPGVLEAYVATGSEAVNNVGSADISTSGDILEISAPISTFTSAANFGGAVPSCGFYQVTAFTMYLHASLGGQDFLFVESTKIGKLYVKNFSSPQPWQYTVGGSNNAPVLSSPGSDDADIWVTYTDSDNNQAVQAQVSIDGGAPVTMTSVDHTYTDGSVYRCTVGDLLPGTSLDFSFTDGMAPATIEYSVGIDEQKMASLPSNMELHCAPNPFNPAAQITFTVDEATRANMAVYNANGRKVAQLISNTEIDAGTHTTRFDASEYDIPAGIYLVSLETPKMRVTEKIIYMK